MDSNILDNITEALEAKNGEDILTLDLKGRGGLADAFVLVTGNSETHMRTLTDAAEEVMLKNGRKCKVEGAESSNWRLLDGGDVVVHVFSHKGREFYRLERLWED